MIVKRADTKACSREDRTNFFVADQPLDANLWFMWVLTLDKTRDKLLE